MCLRQCGAYTGCAFKTIVDWFKGTNKALMILGARQIGKTESVKHFLKSQFGIEEDETFIRNFRKVFLNYECDMSISIGEYFVNYLDAPKINSVAACVCVTLV